MFFPELTPLSRSQEYTQAWGGFDHNLRVAEGAFYDMENLSGDAYPVLMPRRKRSLYRPAGGYVRGMLAKGRDLWYVVGETVYKNGTAIEGFTAPGDEYDDITMLGMGAYILFYKPGSNDLSWYNRSDPADCGQVIQSFAFSLDNPVTLEMCDREGNVYADVHAGNTAPEEPANGTLWLDTTDTLALKKWEGNTGMWMSIAKTYVKISADIAPDHCELKKGDSIELGIRGVSIGSKEVLTEYNTIEAISGDEDEGWYIVVTGIIDETKTQESGLFAIRRDVPAMDYIVESDNRVWGCRYGYSDEDKTKRVNEIYACALGDFKNWRKYQGLSTDSYAASRGSDGPWTGAIVYQGNPIFFKADCMETVYISSTGAHQISVNHCRGCQESLPGNSLAIVNDTLYWYTGREVVAYNGTYPQTVSKALGSMIWDGSAAGVLGSKYYLCLKYGGYGGEEGQKTTLFVYDTSSGLWHKEDYTECCQFAGSIDRLYFSTPAGEIWQAEGSGENKEGELHWMAETGELGLSAPGNKYITRFNLRLFAPRDAWVKIYIQYDSCGQWEKAGYVSGAGILRSRVIPIRPRRCDHMKIRLVGYGDVRLYSLGKVYEEGSDWG